jgi:cysteine desulfurase
MQNDRAHIRALSQKLYAGIMREIPEVHLNGDRESRYEGSWNFSFEYVEGESLLMGLKAVALSSGSACTSASLEPSYVLRALGVDPGLSHTSLRIGIGRFTTEAEITFALNLMKQHVSRLREMSPLWEMAQEGVNLKKIEWSQPH